MVRVHITVSGYVQGVGFRYYAVHTAGRYGITGWVRNRSDGSVEMEAQGGREAVEAFLAAMREGNRYSKVSGVTATPMEAVNECAFEVVG